MGLFQKLTTCFLVSFIGLYLTACSVLARDVTVRVSTTTESYGNYTTSVSACDGDGIDTNTSLSNQTGCDTSTQDEETVPCGECRPRVFWACVNGSAIGSFEQSVVDQVIYVIVYIGYSVSLLACIIANVIYILTRRTLNAKGSPYHIHWNLVATFTVYHVVFLINYNILPRCDVTNMPVRNLLNVLIAYTVLANFFWMLVEGLVLFCIVVKSFFQVQKGRQFIKWCVLGWGGPAVIVLIWIVVEKLSLPEGCTILQLEVANSSQRGIICLGVPVLTILVVNGIVLFVVMRNISGKLKSLDRRDERKRHRRTAKSTLVLLVLLGCYYVLPILIGWIGEPCILLITVSNITYIISSIQGLAVSTLYVFCNAEVRRTIGKRFSDMNGNFVTRITHLSTPTNTDSSGKRSSSSSGSDVKHTGRRSGTCPITTDVEMALVARQDGGEGSDVNSNKPDRSDDDRIVMEVDENIDTTGQSKIGKVQSAAGYSKLGSTDPDEC